jgi:hypothetical protein
VSFTLAPALSKFRTDLTPEQAEIVDAFKQQCPGFAVMRELVLNFRAPLRMGKLAALRRWMKCAQKTGIHGGNAEMSEFLGHCVRK